MANYFIDRPVFAWVLAIIMMLAGGLAIMNLPVAQYPQIAPPTITVSATYPGADAQTVEDSVTVTSVLIPWNTCGMTQATILGVATFTYLPYCFFNLISPLMSITIAAIGFKIKRKNEKAKSVVAG